MNYSKTELINYRIKRSEEAFKDAELLINNESWNSAANRLYYSYFYLIQAFVLVKGLNASTHAGIKSQFNNEFIKKGLIEKDAGYLFNKLFNLRQEADYEDLVDIEKTNILVIFEDSKYILSEIKIIIQDLIDKTD